MANFTYWQTVLLTHFSDSDSCLVLGRADFTPFWSATVNSFIPAFSLLYCPTRNVLRGGGGGLGGNITLRM